VLDEVSIADLAKGALPKKVAKLLDDPGVWAPR
jgi:hypothetical protein